MSVWDVYQWNGVPKLNKNETESEWAKQAMRMRKKETNSIDYRERHRKVIYNKSWSCKEKKNGRRRRIFLYKKNGKLNPYTVHIDKDMHTRVLYLQRHGIDQTRNKQPNKASRAISNISNISNSRTKSLCDVTMLWFLVWSSEREAKNEQN